MNTHESRPEKRRAAMRPTEHEAVPDPGPDAPAQAANDNATPLLSSRLVFTGILAAGMALMTVVLALTAVDYWSARQSMLQDSRVEAAIVADNLSAAVMFRDANTANEILGALRASPMVQAAAAYDASGTLLAQ